MTALKALRTTLIPALFLFFPPSSLAAGNDYKKMARQFSQAAHRHKAGKIAVLPFSTDNAFLSQEGNNAARRLTTQLVRLGKVEVVERELLAQIMSEQRLQHIGAIRADHRSQAGGLTPADAIVTGSIFSAGGKLEVHARMIELRSGKVLSAYKARFETDWSAMRVAVPKLEVFAPPLNISVPDVLWDAISDTHCGQSEHTINTMERAILDVKSRYWAAKLEDPNFSIARLLSNPGSEIMKPEIRRQFHFLVSSKRLRRDTVRPTHFEIVRLKKVMEKILNLTNSCGGEGGELRRAIRQIETY